jgi:serine/threonine protein kinase
MFQFVVTAGPDKGTILPLKAGASVQVGRSQTTAARLTDPAVSRVHFKVEVGLDQAILHNLSTQGTLVNGKPVTERELKVGDVVRLGGTELQFLVAEPSEDITETPKTAAAAAPGVIGELRSLDELVGKTLAHFSIERILAQGNSGIVFRATDTNDDNTVALKVLQPEFAKNDEDVQRFIRAMKTMMPVRHPNLVATYGAGKTGSYCWISMEHIEGDSLSKVIKDIGVLGMLGWKKAYGVAVDIAKALEFAHSQAIIHRNVTPTNIIVRVRDQSAVLGDLMLAKALEGALAKQITRPGEMVGDISYMSPEQTRGTDVDERSDLYGLGATVYAMLTGRPPFKADALPELIVKIRKDEPEKPKKFQMAIPDLFEGVVLRLLAKKPEARYQTATELLDDLKRVGTFAGADR